jgi:hypothetical protein
MTRVCSLEAHTRSPSLLAQRTQHLEILPNRLLVLLRHLAPVAVKDDECRGHVRMLALDLRMSVGDDCRLILGRDGIVEVPIDILPEEIQDQFGIDLLRTLDRLHGHPDFPLLGIGLGQFLEEADKLGVKCAESRHRLH